MLSRRLVSVQPDILEWFSSQRNTLKFLRQEHYKLEKGFIAYFKSIVEFLRPPKPLQSSKQEDAEKKEFDHAQRSISQFYDSEELTKRMKWKRVTWDEDADYSAFSRRVLENDIMFKRVPSFSFMSIHIIKDPLTTDFLKLPPPKKKLNAGDLSLFFLQEREPTVIKSYSTMTTAQRRSAFKVDWCSGNVEILDTASAQEILTFLLTVAPRLQVLQMKMEKQQTYLARDIDRVKLRVGASIKFNQFDTSFWDDAKRLTDPNYVNPDELEFFLQSILKSALLYRWFLKGQLIRVVPSGRSYFINLETKEVYIPANFAQYNWLKAHDRFTKIESIFDGFRKLWWFWFCLGMVVVGDLEVL